MQYFNLMHAKSLSWRIMNLKETLICLLIFFSLGKPLLNGEDIELFTIQTDDMWLQCND